MTDEIDTYYQQWAAQNIQIVISEVGIQSFLYLYQDWQPSIKGKLILLQCQICI